MLNDILSHFRWLVLFELNWLILCLFISPKEPFTSLLHFLMLRHFLLWLKWLFLGNTSSHLYLLHLLVNLSYRFFNLLVLNHFWKLTNCFGFLMSVRFLLLFFWTWWWCSCPYGFGNKVFHFGYTLLFWKIDEMLGVFSLLLQAHVHPCRMQVTRHLITTSIQQRKIVNSCIKLWLLTLWKFSFFNFLWLGCRIHLYSYLINLKFFLALNRLFHLLTDIWLLLLFL